PWSQAGTEEGDPVFVVGNPGSTSRLTTVSQLRFERDVTLPLQLDALTRRADVLEQYTEAHPDSAEQYDLRNTYFSMANSIKANRGQLDGLKDPQLIARRQAAQEELLAQAPDSLKPEVREVLQSVREVQQSKQALTPRAEAFAFFGTELGARVFLRGLYGYFYSVLKQRGAPADRLEEIKEQALGFDDWPQAVEEAFLRIRLRELRDALGTDDPTLRRVLQGRTPAGLAADLAANSALTDSASYAQVLEEGYLQSDDPSVPIIDALAPLYFQFAEQQQGLQSREDNLNARLARVRFAVYGPSVPPDASFSPRLADGVVQGYTFNGTRAPAFTTFFGLFNHYYAYGDDSAWDLPDRWLNSPDTFDRSTPLNLVTTNDITGGNSGSPLLNEDLELVGLIFDSNIEALPNQYLYTDRVARAVSVDARGILEALDDVYDADRLVLELTTGRQVSTEAEADAMTAGTR
ncbi:MAG: S46 family peptidase, partial [Bacteroidetes bacterium]|nr:S46 family peptidase [Bacteroidota bacterium]